MYVGRIKGKCNLDLIAGSQTSEPTKSALKNRVGQPLLMNSILFHTIHACVAAGATAAGAGAAAGTELWNSSHSSKAGAALVAGAGLVVEENTDLRKSGISIYKYKCIQTNVC